MVHRQSLTSPAVVKKILAERGVRPQKRLGQNFLSSPAVVAFMLAAARITNKDVVLEAGGGIGTLTRALAENAARVVVVEKDPAMVGILKETVGDLANAEVVQGDVLGWDAGALGKAYKLVANPPYYLASALVRRFLETEPQPSVLVLLLQKEVARRMAAAPPRMHLLSAAVQAYAEVRVLKTVPKNAFWPQPNVDSAVVKIVPRADGLSFEERGPFFGLVKAGFSHPRRQLVNNLAEILGRERAKDVLEQKGLEPTIRAERLSVKDWRRLAGENNSSVV